ncbi:MAG TPA: hypothetical protein PK307_04850, partial [Spirochaetota bacterium]|nr:hypothetical protein [Spirochaetota bacterium]
KHTGISGNPSGLTEFPGISIRIYFSSAVMSILGAFSLFYALVVLRAIFLTTSGMKTYSENIVTLTLTEIFSGDTEDTLIEYVSEYIPGSPVNRGLILYYN